MKYIFSIILFLSLITAGNSFAQNVTITYGDTLYMDRTWFVKEKTYEDTAKYTIKGKFLNKNYFVVSEDKMDTFMIITDSISSFFSDEGVLNLQTLKYKGQYYADINYEFHYAITTEVIAKRIIISHPSTESDCMTYFFDFDDNWKLIKYFTWTTTAVYFVNLNPNFTEFGSYFKGVKDGAWLVLNNGIADRIDVFVQGEIVYTISLPK